MADKCKPLWGMDEEGEINGCWKDMGVPGLWYIMGMLLYFLFLSSGRPVLLSFFPLSFSQEICVPLYFSGETPAPFVL